MRTRNPTQAGAPVDYDRGSEYFAMRRRLLIAGLTALVTGLLAPVAFPIAAEAGNLSASVYLTQNKIPNGLNEKGLPAEVVRFRDSCRVFADLARKANQDQK